LNSVLRPRQHSIGYMGDGFYTVKGQIRDPNMVRAHISKTAGDAI